MKTTGIVIDSWKIHIFRSHLARAGFEHTEHDGPLPDIMTLKVKTKTVAELQPVVEAANKEAAEQKKRGMT